MRKWLDFRLVLPEGCNKINHSQCTVEINGLIKYLFQSPIAEKIHGYNFSSIIFDEESIIPSNYYDFAKNRLEIMTMRQSARIEIAKTTPTQQSE